MDWKTVPHLFANGKFGFRYKDYAEFGPQFRIIGEPDFFDMQIIISEPDLEIDFTECQLIARKTEDMTDEECKTCQGLKITSVDVDDIYKISGNFVDTVSPLESPESFMYKLSIGVYPFEWPKDETVIDKDTLG